MKPVKKESLNEEEKDRIIRALHQAFAALVAEKKANRKKLLILRNGHVIKLDPDDLQKMTPGTSIPLSP